MGGWVRIRSVDRSIHPQTIPSQTLFDGWMDGSNPNSVDPSTNQRIYKHTLSTSVTRSTPPLDSTWSFRSGSPHFFPFAPSPPRELIESYMSLCGACVCVWWKGSVDPSTTTCELRAVGRLTHTHDTRQAVSDRSIELETYFPAMRAAASALRANACSSLAACVCL